LIFILGRTGSHRGFLSNLCYKKSITLVAVEEMDRNRSIIKFKKKLWEGTVARGPGKRGCWTRLGG
jgi:hypothetical protein